MKRFNCIMVYHEEKEQMLLCLRAKEPYQGKYNLVGGKLEENEDSLQGAYRELQEETGITSEDITLKPVMNLQYFVSDQQLEIYAGRLKHQVELVEEVNQLCWMPLTENFFDSSKYAGEGNIGHMVEVVNRFRRELLETEK